MNYELHIGERVNITTDEIIPESILIVTESQLEMIYTFADTYKDKSTLQTIYKLNEIEFKVFPQIRKPATNAKDLKHL